MAEKFYAIKFVVKGAGRFPTDMLRYDRCCPATETDSSCITEHSSRAQPRRVNLVRFSQAGKSGPCMRRWESFGWKVTSVTYADGKTEWFDEQVP
jgi:hypothetical protein